MPGICAVVVTFNRKNLLAICLETILGGELAPDGVLVVDNASSDGTPEFVESLFDGRVSVLRLKQNRGGAGGFKVGVEETLRRGYDFLWTMDDDHEVDSEALKRLKAAMDQYYCDAVGPMIVAPTRDDRLCWEMGPGGKGYFTLSAIQKAYAGSGYFQKIPDAFNATLYRRSVFERIGLPDERLFIRGDEVEFGLRMEKNNVKGVVLTEAIVYHPPSPGDTCEVVTFWGVKLTAYYTGNRLKDYCIFRNRAFYFKKYGRYRSLLLDPPRYLVFFLMTRKFDIAGFRLWRKGYFDGLAGRFGYERELLKPQ
jgi:rhamnopyranosyl-N-acetylglucosaminyl-diphospho-decaprenol beta-1,3/1,4-galactofuranosyltransferase